ncbi:MAG: hypothetical protein LC774_11050 [Acidobacteria bacterium]|nr:hypothetical protein [Acidobacteriota bacterium]
MPRRSRAAKKIDDSGARAKRDAAPARAPAKKIRPKEKRVASNPKEKPPAPKPTVAIVGAGRLGAALAVALERCGYRVNALVARERSHARRASRLLSPRRGPARRRRAGASRCT